MEQHDKSKNESGDEKDSFFQRVYAVVKLIPYGRVTSYGAIANYLGSRGSARMVGWAMNTSFRSYYSDPCTQGCQQEWYANGQASFWKP